MKHLDHTAGVMFVCISILVSSTACFASPTCFEDPSLQSRIEFNPKDELALSDVAVFAKVISSWKNLAYYRNLSAGLISTLTRNRSTPIRSGASMYPPSAYDYTLQLEVLTDYKHSGNALSRITVLVIGGGDLCGLEGVLPDDKSVGILAFGKLGSTLNREGGGSFEPKTIYLEPRKLIALDVSTDIDCLQEQYFRGERMCLREVRQACEGAAVQVEMFVRRRMQDNPCVAYERFKQTTDIEETIRIDRRKAEICSFDPQRVDPKFPSRDNPKSNYGSACKILSRSLQEQGNFEGAIEALIRGCSALDYYSCQGLRMYPDWDTTLHRAGEKAKRFCLSPGLTQRQLMDCCYSFETLVEIWSAEDLERFRSLAAPFCQM